ncbi:HK97-gp10 family putative phage morphogenesis protein [Macrococcus equipercicus]|uniref:HK97 gp10 family phage protein n=1 Tax=Macrococcus equipercicus TaxID=69967 RepID=A0A9Q9BVS2_9STAP|nr:HK97-gp10 family putative phage morphogenesis protein [Macrococcus equipercicus]UTH13297.1 hypothetical protein KFV11_08485 [Macrococcus equipercicus]
MSLDISKFDDSGIKQLLKRVNGSSDKILMAGAEVQYDQIKKDIFVDEGTARDRLSIGEPHRENGELVIKIGWPKGSGVEYRAHFVEWGTVHIKPQLKITRAVKQSENAKRKAMIDVMRKEYGLHG